MVVLKTVWIKNTATAAGAGLIGDNNKM